MDMHDQDVRQQQIGLPPAEDQEGVAAMKSANEQAMQELQDIDPIVKHWVSNFGNRVRQCESCGGSFTITETAGLGGCFIHPLPANEYTGIHPCCGYNSYACAPIGRITSSSLAMARNYGNCVGCVHADHHTAGMRKGSRTAWGVPIPRGLIAARRAGKVVSGAILDPEHEVAKPILQGLGGAKDFVVVNGCHAHISNQTGFAARHGVVRSFTMV